MSQDGAFCELDISLSPLRLTNKVAAVFLASRPMYKPCFFPEDLNTILAHASKLVEATVNSKHKEGWIICARWAEQ